MCHGRAQIEGKNMKCCLTYTSRIGLSFAASVFALSFKLILLVFDLIKLCTILITPIICKISGQLDPPSWYSYSDGWHVHLYHRSTISNSISSRPQRVDATNQVGTKAWCRGIRMSALNRTNKIVLGSSECSGWVNSNYLGCQYVL